MPLFVDDYEAATAHLTVEEDGIYIRLLRLCWRTPGCSIPADEKWICRQMRCRDWDKIKAILDEFFQLQKGRYFQKRQRSEWRSKNETIQARKRAGSKGGKAKAMKYKKKTSSKAKDLLKQKSSKSLASRTRTISIKKEKKILKEKFENEFWPICPRKDAGKAQSEKAFLKACKREKANTILAKWKEACEHWDETGVEKRFIPHPTTWLNQDRWTAEILKDEGNSEFQKELEAL
ncbi:YdaU family protein [candidate division KSB1 bacterium]|nr:YdaU family protein [candidate division KSB1 bacterium]NIX74750.1 DUF1376 domain-containing protein [candidate division KSB1 bacterium]